MCNDIEYRKIEERSNRTFPNLRLEDMDVDKSKFIVSQDDIDL